MTIPEYVEGLTRYANNYLLRTVRAMPADRWSWKPMEEGRTVVDQVMECAQAADWFTRILTTRDAAFFTAEFIGAEREARAAATDLDAAEALLNHNSEAMFQAFRALEGQDMSETVEIMPGWNDSLANVMFMPLRNLWYHIGQVNYIQTLYGDREMH